MLLIHNVGLNYNLEMIITLSMQIMIRIPNIGQIYNGSKDRSKQVMVEERKLRGLTM